MAETTEIGWTDSTLNLWIGCTKVGPGCDFCYAEAFDNRFGGGHWGPGAPRRVTSRANWNQAYSWNRAAKAAGVRRKVFVNSLSDFWDNEISAEIRLAAIMLFKECDWLDFQLVTKRIGNIGKFMPDSWRMEWPQKVWQLITIIDQSEADRDIPKLVSLKKAHNIRIAGLSIEPMLGPIDLSAYIKDLDWVIVGGESGHHARPIHADWVRAIRDLCLANGVPFFFKQWGEFIHVKSGYPIGPCGVLHFDGRPISVTQKWPDESTSLRIGKKAAGNQIDGAIHQEFPQ